MTVKAGNYLDTGIGIVFVVLGRRILDGKPGVSGRGTSPGLVFHRAGHNKAAVFNIYASSTSNENLLNRLTWQRGYRCLTSYNFTIGVDGRTKNSGGVRITVNHEKLNQICSLSQLSIPREEQVLD